MYIKNSSDESEEIEFYYTKSIFGNKMLVVNGFRFKFHKDLGNGKKRYICINTADKCRAFAYTVDDVLERVDDSHNHPWAIGRTAKTRKLAIADGSGTHKPYYIPIDPKS
ncbi:hypothetical protein O0L34_g17108 [Tuta absoluta]|nr:hypothetical protein O0L34_g17108 [Tuta absoluta]